MVPKEAMGGCSPNPMKLRNASVNIAVGIVNIVVIIIGPIEFGIKCRHISLVSPAPKVLDANTNSCPSI